MTTPPDEAITVIVPVKDMTDHLRECLDTLGPDLGTNDVITVVDDASATDDVAAVCREAGVDHRRLPRSQGPYVARHVAALAATTPLLLFVDTRCRARRGLLDAHRRLLGRDGVALSATETPTVSRGSYAARVAAFKRPFTVTGKVFEDTGAGRLSFFPTANLGVRADAYRAVGGFRRMRSGADADLCWRIQLAGLGTFAADERELMAWVPRDRWQDLNRQWARYGDSSAVLAQLYHGQTPASVELGDTGRTPLRAYAERLRSVRTGELPLAAGAALVHRSYVRALREGLQRPAEQPRPIEVDPVALG